MRLSRSLQIFRIIFKERYRDPTLELILPTMLLSNVFLSAFYERSGFELFGIVLAFIPIISVSETLAFSLGLRNIVFVTGDHMYRGSIISFLMSPIKREELFVFIYISDVVLPLLFWVSSTLFYSFMAEIGVPPLLYLTFISGYFFAENVTFLLTILFRSPGVSTLISMFILGGTFILGGSINYYLLIQGFYNHLYLTSFTNPYVLWIVYSLGKNVLPQIVFGVEIDLILAVLALTLTFVKFMRLEV
ncbi:hypothetical protein CM19_01655 [Candidatus Acidianus copahuensis]|uniref:Uncharacterized protein n=1 Tax=Candidatus Acidianus copahuensis TaxID=1160895 RepID=A0A031LTT4_9CREN|nr:hypothetical protein [Candidatus Acidianus copahuensis]EZQ11221.1 hypothetical protein CM19_01655 [Candidatus Acidianus copahuensis]